MMSSYPAHTPNMSDGNTPTISAKSPSANSASSTSPSAVGSSASAQRRKRSQNACTACRQQKLRCDASARFPNSCSRCAKKGLSCRIDPTFRRTSTRNRLQEVSKELEELRALRAASTELQQVELVHVLPPPESSNTQPADIFPLPADPSDLPPTLDEVILPPPEELQQFFCNFHTHYHPHLPVADCTVPLATLLQRSPFLFLVILFVSTRSAVGSPLHGSLNAAVTLHTQTAATCPPHTTIEDVVAALLLLALYPPTFKRQDADVSYIRSGMATHLALQNNFHRTEPVGYLQWPVIDRSMLRKNLIWRACFLADYELAQKQGLPSTMVADWVVRNPPPDGGDAVMARFNTQLATAVAATQAHSALSSPLTPDGLVEPRTRWTLVQIFDTTLQAPMSSSSSLPPLSSASSLATPTLHSLTARLQLHSYVLAEDVQAVISRADIASSTTAGFQISLQIVALLSDIHARGLLSYYPTTVVRTLVLASIWLLKLVASAAIPATRVEVARNGVREVLRLCDELVRLPGDEMTRAAEFIKFVSTLGRNSGRKGTMSRWTQKGYETRSRLGHGLFYDALREMKELELSKDATTKRGEDPGSSESESEHGDDGDGEAGGRGGGANVYPENGQQGEGGQMLDPEGDREMHLDWPFLHDDFWTNFADPTGLTVGGLEGTEPRGGGGNGGMGMGGDGAWRSEPEGAFV